jgi:hypothetical protein
MIKVIFNHIYTFISFVLLKSLRYTVSVNRSKTSYTRRNLASCGKSANKPSTSCVRTACPKLSTSVEELVNSCNKLVDIIRLVARLFQQVRYSHDITILLQPCVVNLVTFLWLMVAWGLRKKVFL